MKQYLHYFRWLFVAAAILVVLYLWLLWENHILLGGGERRNEECRTQERVFDYGDVLTEEEEEELVEPLDRAMGTAEIATMPRHGDKDKKHVSAKRVPG